MNVAVAVPTPRRGRASFDRSKLVAMHVRRAPAVAVLGAAVVGGTAVVLRAIYVDTSLEVLQYARLSAVIIAAAAAATLENSCSEITSATSLRRSVSAWLSVGLTGVCAMVVWIVAVAVARSVAGEPEGMPLGGLTIELIALLAVGWLMTEVISGVRGPSGAGALAGASLVLTVVMTLMTPNTIEWLWRGPDPDWRVIHLRWAAIAAIASALLAVTVRDAAAPRPRLRRKPSRSTSARSTQTMSLHTSSHEESDEF